MDDWESAFRAKSERRRKRAGRRDVSTHVVVLAIVAMVVAAGLITLDHWTP